MYMKPIFIAGSERSGTTLLRLMLHSHPRIAIPPQTKYMKKIYKRRLMFGNLENEKNRKKLALWFNNNFNASTKIDDLNIELNEVIQEILSSKSLGAALAVPWNSYAKKHSKERWGDKRPYYIHHMDKLRELYPDAQIIHMIRDCRDVIASLNDMPWWHKTFEYSILNWKSAILHGLTARQNTKIDEYIELRYEDLITNPEYELSRLCQFLGEEYNPAMLDFQKTSEFSVPNYKMAWHGATRGPLNSRSVGRWKRDLTAYQISLIQWAVGDELFRLGYDLSKTEPLSIKHQMNFNLKKTKFKIEDLYRNFGDNIISLLYSGRLDYRIE